MFPALVIQSDLFNAHPRLRFLLLTSELRRLRDRAVASSRRQNGPENLRQIMVDKIRHRRKVFGGIGAGWLLYPRSGHRWRCSSSVSMRNPYARAIPSPPDAGPAGFPVAQMGDLPGVHLRWAFWLGVVGATGAMAHATRHEPELKKKNVLFAANTMAEDRSLGADAPGPEDFAKALPENQHQRGFEQPVPGTMVMFTSGAVTLTIERRDSRVFPSR